jgi:prepilin-type N-terminal cleavage/methylation domain-containing protein
MHRSRGQTLIELLVAVAVISTGLFASMNLVYSNLALVDRDTDEVVAINLAREAIEISKQIRDSNWLEGSAFDKGLYDPADVTDYTATPLWEPSLARPAFSFEANSFEDENASIVSATTTQVQGFLANRNVGADINGNGTSYKRLITFHPICSDNSVLDAGSCGGALSKVGVRIEARMRWTRRGIEKGTVIYEDLYDWK